MFILDLQGEPKGLSIGGLAVITKSLSLTVSYRDVVPSNEFPESQKYSNFLKRSSRDVRAGLVPE